MKKGFIYKAALSTASLAMVFGLAGCGQKSSSNAKSSTPKSSKVTLSASDKAYKSANDLISEGKYQKAYNTLDNVENESKKVEYLEDDLENYMDAKSYFDKGNYQKAEAALPGMKSESKPMRKAYKALRVKISKAINGEIESSTSSNSGSSKAKTNSSTNSSSTANSTSSSVSDSSSATTSSTTTHTPANAAAAQATSENVISKFANNNGFNKSGYGIIPVSKNGNTYRFEVRQDNSDNTVANMVGIYEYNSSTGTTSKIN